MLHVPYRRVSDHQVAVLQNGEANAVTTEGVSHCSTSYVTVHIVLYGALSVCLPTFAEVCLHTQCPLAWCFGSNISCRFLNLSEPWVACTSTEIRWCWDAAWYIKDCLPACYLDWIINLPGFILQIWLNPERSKPAHFKCLPSPPWSFKKSFHLFVVLGLDSDKSDLLSLCTIPVDLLIH